MALRVGSELPEWASEPRKQPERSTHWITKLKRTKIPAAHICLDSEARIVKVAGRFEHRFAVAVTQFIDGSGNGFVATAHNAVWSTPDELWHYIDTKACGELELVVWAHNLPYDLRVCDGLRQLLKLGWTLENISLMRTASWASWVKGGFKLTLTDSVSWWKVGLDKIAEGKGAKRRRFDYGKATDAQLERRCIEDVKLLSESVCAVLNWIRDEDLGNFRPTGSGQSHAAWRKRFMPERSVRVHDNGWALHVERQAMHTGRTEAWRLGKIAEPLHELDLNLAYCRIAAHNPLPQWLNGESASATVKQFEQRGEDQAWLADVTVTTEQPIVPVARDERVVWPVGTFTTQLWDPEVDALIDAGADVRFNYVWLYKTGWALGGMAAWILDQLHDPPEGQHPAVARTLKHWARTLVGRMALRYRQWDHDGENERADLCISYEPDLDSGDVHREMRVGNTVLLLAQLAESKSSCPMVPGWVMSRCRAIMWGAIQAAGQDNVYYIDTDGLLVNEQGRDALLRAGLGGGDWALVHKARHHGVCIHGERNVEVGKEYRLAGIPKSATRTDDTTFEGETWAGLERALEQGHTDYVSVSPAKWQVKPQSHRRETIDELFTAPYRLGG